VDAASGRIFRVGDALQVEVISVSLLRRRIELAPVGAGGVVRARGETELPEESRRPAKARRLADAVAQHRRKGPARQERGPKPGTQGTRRGTGHQEKGRGGKRRR
jgi:hypothetical protein